MTIRENIFLLFIFIGLSHSLTAQNEKDTWQFGFGGGVNIINYQANSFSGSLVVDVTQKVEQERSLGFQGSLTISYQLSRLLQVQSGIGIRRVKTLADILTVTRFPYLGSTISVEKVHQELVLVETPLNLRLHLRGKKSLKQAANLFLEIGAIYQFPIVDQSQYQKQEGSKTLEERKIKLKNLSAVTGIGVAFSSQNALVLNVSMLNNNLPEGTLVWGLSYTHFFKQANN